MQKNQFLKVKSNLLELAKKFYRVERYGLE